METDPQENTDLLNLEKGSSKREVKKDETNGIINNVECSVPTGPPDGGLRAYLIMIGSFLINGLLFGVINSYSVIYDVLLSKLSMQGVPNADSRACE